MRHDLGASADAETGSREPGLASRPGPSGVDPARIEYRSRDKQNWERGPWDSEPDKVQWYDEATGLPCLIVRGPLGALCGYVGVRPGHPWHGVDYDSVRLVGGEDEWPDVHGGLTFAGPCQDGDQADGVCHLPRPGDTDDIWWLGFDCAHLGDYCDMQQSQRHRERCPKDGRDVYRDIAYVSREVANLAAQAASGIEAATAGETVQHGSTEGESPTVATSDGDAQPQSGVNRHG